MICVDVLASLPESNRYRPRPNRKSGILIRPECSLGVLVGGGYGMKNTVSVNYQFNPYFVLGGGLSLSGTQLLYLNKYPGDLPNETTGYYNNGSSLISYGSDEGLSLSASMPLFFNARIYFCDRNWSPFVDLKLGYSFALKDGYVRNRLYKYDDTDHSDDLVFKKTYNTKGFLADITLGMKYKIFSFGITTGMFTILDNGWKTELRSSDLGDEEWNKEYYDLSLFLNFSWDIPVGRK